MSNQAHILIVDDNQINRQYFSMSLKKTFAHVDVAENGFNAIEQAKNNDYDLILMDIRMPDMDGYETTKNIRLLENHHKTTIIATSAESISSNHKELFDDFIAKPIRPKHLQNIVHEYTDKYTEKTASDKLVFSKEAALKYAYEDDEIMHKLITMMLDDLPKQLQSLNIALEKNNNDLCLEILHKLQGSCLTCGAQKLNIECKNLADAIKSNSSNATLTTNTIHKAAHDFIQLFESIS